MAATEIKSYGIVLGNFPVLALVIENTPAIIGDVPADFEKQSDYVEEGIKSTPAHKNVALGLLGLKIPVGK